MWMQLSRLHTWPLRLAHAGKDRMEFVLEGGGFVFHLLIKAKEKEGKTRPLAPCEVKGTKPACGPPPRGGKEAEGGGESVWARAVISPQLLCDRARSPMGARCQELSPIPLA